MPFLTTALGFAGRHWKLIGMGVLIALFLTTCARLDNAKKDLGETRASLKATRAALINPATKATWQADYGTCKANVTELAGALTAQSKSLAAVSAEGQRRLAASTTALERQRAATATAIHRANELLRRPPVGADACARVADADARVLESLRGGQ